MKRFILSFIQAWELNRKKAREKSTIRLLERSEFSLQMVEKICKEYGYHFEYIFRDGDSIKFYKDGIEVPSAVKVSGEYW